MDPEFDNLKQAPTFVEQANTSVNETDDCNPGIKVIGVGGGGSNAVANKVAVILLLIISPFRFDRDNYIQ